jgi:hypothetical protein
MNCLMRPIDRNITSIEYIEMEQVGRNHLCLMAIVKVGMMGSKL